MSLGLWILRCYRSTLLWHGATVSGTRAQLRTTTSSHRSSRPLPAELCRHAARHVDDPLAYHPPPVEAFLRQERPGSSIPQRTGLVHESRAKDGIRDQLTGYRKGAGDVAAHLARGLQSGRRAFARDGGEEARHGDSRKVAAAVHLQQCHGISAQLLCLPVPLELWVSANAPVGANARAHRPLALPTDMLACRADGRAPLATFCSLVRGSHERGPAAGDRGVPAGGKEAGHDQHQVGVGYCAGGMADGRSEGEGRDWNVGAFGCCG